MATIKTARQAIAVHFRDSPELLGQCDIAVARLGAAWHASQGSSPARRFFAIMQVADQDVAARLRESGTVLPCQRGCHHCCVQEVTVFATEAVLIVQFIEHQMDAQQRADTVARIRTSGRSGATAQSACAMLDESRSCSAYSHRPLTCRSYLGLAEPACRSYRERRDRAPPVFTQAVVVDVAVREVTRLHRRSARYEINALLRRIYADPRKIAAWADERPTDESDLALS